MYIVVYHTGQSTNEGRCCIITARKPSCGKVMFLQVSVILLTGDGGTCPIACWDTPPVQCMLGYGQQTGGTHPTGMQSCLTFVCVNTGGFNQSSSLIYTFFCPNITSMPSS